jgi:glyoxylase-like metal-dependent hydrolase (beta-lactamase superfamily II)
MLPEYEILVPGTPTTGSGGYLRFANLTLVTTAGFRLLFDTGHLMNRRRLLSALAVRGLAPADIDMVFLSHVHFDHADNIDLFPRAAVFLSRADLDYSHRPARDDAFVPWMLADQLRHHKLELLDGQTELGGGITALELPGHTPGSMGIIFRGGGGVVVVAGDALADPAAVDCRDKPTGRRPPAFDSGEALRESACRVLRTADVIIPGHFSQLCRVSPSGFAPVDEVNSEARDEQA